MNGQICAKNSIVSYISKRREYIAPVRSVAWLWPYDIQLVVVAR
jgi:hypothetical protein